MFADGQDELAVPWTINGLAAVLAAKGDLPRAAKLVGVAESLLERAGGEWPPDERAQYESTLERLSEAPRRPPSSSDGRRGGR